MPGQYPNLSASRPFLSPQLSTPANRNSAWWQTLRGDHQSAIWKTLPEPFTGNISHHHTCLESLHVLSFWRYVCLSVTVWWVGCRRCLVSHDHSQLTIASPADPLVGDLHRFQSRTWKQEKQFSPQFRHDRSWDYQGTQVFVDRTAGFAVLHEGFCCWNCLEGCCGALKLW